MSTYICTKLMSSLCLFAAQLLITPEQQQQMTVAMKEATSINGNQEFKGYLEKSGISWITVSELRHLGPETDGQLVVTPYIDVIDIGATNTPQPVPESDNSDESSSIDGATIGIIVGSVAGGLAVIALVVALLISNSRNSGKKDRDSITEHWKLERELAEAERVKLESESKPSLNSSLKWSSAREAGMMTLTQSDLEHRREMRRAESLATSQRLATTPVIDYTAKPSKLDSMRSALGLGKGTPSKKSQGSITFGTPQPDNATAEIDVESKRKWSPFKK